MSTFRDAAIALANAGFRVFPLAPGSKVPAFEGDWQRRATSDIQAITDIWTDDITGWDQPYNIGVALSADVLVVDVDVRDGKPGAHSLRLLEALYDPLPETYTTTTASGGQHRYFRIKDIPAVGKILANGIDLKTAGGYVVGAGSVIGTGSYTAAGDPTRLAELPQPFVELARRSERPAPAARNVSVELDSNDAISRAIAYLTREAPDAGTYKVAAKVKDYGVSEAVAVDLLCEHWAEPRSLGKDRDHIAVRVANAYTYGKSPVGIASPEAEFEAVELPGEDPGQPGKTRGALYYQPYRDDLAAQKAPHLIRGWYDLGAMVVTYGESGVGKTNVVLNQSFAIAAGQAWADAKVRPGLVVYVAAEGGRGVRKRLTAYKKRYPTITDIPFALVPCPVDLLRPTGDTKRLIELVHEAEADFGCACVMVVLDTLSRVLAGGNENGPEDMGALVKHCDQIRAATAATVHLIHHSGKNQASGARGHSLLRAATDTEIELAAPGTIRGTKQRDMEFNGELAFELETVDIGRDEEGERVTSVVCHVKRPNEFETRLSEDQARLLDVLSTLAGGKAGERIASTRWKAALGIAPRSAADRAFLRTAGELVQSGQVDAAQDGRENVYWLVKSDNQDADCDKAGTTAT